MNSLSIPSQTMSSREIAELTGKEHKNVLADARKMLDDLGLTSAEFSAVLPDAYGRAQTVLRLPKRETLILVSGYSVAMRAKIIDRWQELEAQAQPALSPANLSRLQLIELAMQAEQERLVLADKVEAMAPKVEALERIADAEGLMNPTNAAKALQVPPHRLFTYLRTNSWVYRRPGARSDVAYQDKIAAGLLTHKVHVARREDGTEKVCEQVMVTSKGLAKLASVMSSSEAACPA